MSARVPIASSFVHFKNPGLGLCLICTPWPGATRRIRREEREEGGQLRIARHLRKKIELADSDSLAADGVDLGMSRTIENEASVVAGGPCE